MPVGWTEQNVHIVHTCIVYYQYSLGIMLIVQGCTERPIPILNVFIYSEIQLINAKVFCLKIHLAFGLELLGWGKENQYQWTIYALTTSTDRHIK